MVSTEFSSVPDWLRVKTETSANLVKTRVPAAAKLFLPNDVCTKLGSEGLELAVTSGLFGPPEAACSVLLDSSIFSKNSDPDEDSNPPENDDAQITNYLEKYSVAVRSLPILRRLSTIWFVFILTVICRCVFFIRPVPFVLELLVSYGLLLLASSIICLSLMPTKSVFSVSDEWWWWSMIIKSVLIFSSIVVHGTLAVFISTFPLSIFQGGPEFIPGMAIFRKTWVLSLTALVVVAFSFINGTYIPRLVSHWLALTAVVLDGIQMCPSSSYYYGPGINDESCFFKPTTALTLILALLLSALMSESMKYTKLKSYS
eukprot:g2180.t1